MKQLLFQSNQGIFFYKEVRAGFCTVKVQRRSEKRPYTICGYTFPAVKLQIDSPFISWENLNCCDGWPFDETYLHTAVQEGKKLYAGCCKHLDTSECMNKARADLETLRRSLPDYCTAGEELVRNENFFLFFICRRGRLQDFYDLDMVFSDYSALGVHLSGQDCLEIRRNCEIELAQFGSGVPFDYANPSTLSDVITTGLLLGYPLESTASLLTR